MPTDRGRSQRRSGRALRRRRQAGTASVEAVLTLPFLLLIVVLAENSTVLMNRKLVGSIETRTKAWEAATASSCPPGASCRSLHGRNLLGRMERAGGTAANGITRVVRRASAARTTEMRGSRVFEPFGDERLVTPLRLESKHALSANPAWELEDLPIGYDQTLKDRLRGMRTVFPNLFPRAR